MAIKKKDNIVSKDQSSEVIREVVRTEILSAITEVVIPALDQVYSKIEDLEKKTENNFSIVNRKLTDLSLDTPSREEFKKHDHRIQRLENEFGFV